MIFSLFGLRLGWTLIVNSLLICKSSPLRQINRKRALAFARVSRYRDAMWCLGFQCTASHHESNVLEEIYQHHPEHVLPTVTVDIPPSLYVSLDSVLASLQDFPRASSPGVSQLNS